MKIKQRQHSRSLRILTRFWILVLLTVTATVPADARAPFIVHVDAGAAPGGDGTARFPYVNLPEAVAAARAIPGPVAIKVRPGDYPLSETLQIDRPLELRGSTEQFEGSDHWPSGEVVPGTATRVFTTNPNLEKLLLVSAGSVDAGGVLGDVQIRNFIFQITRDGISIQLYRVQGFRISGNVFRSPAQYGIHSVASTGTVTGNHFSGIQTGAILAAGYPDSEAAVTFEGNRSVRNTAGGVLLNGASIDIPEPGESLRAFVRNNDLSENVGMRQGFGVRAFTIRRDPGENGATQSTGNVTAVIEGNRIVGNRFGIVVDAGFPYRVFEKACDNRVYSGNMNLKLVGNTVWGNERTSGIVSFTRYLESLRPADEERADYQYLHRATFIIDDRDGILTWWDHPETDPYLGSCAGDSTRETLDNVWIYNGEPQLHGRNIPIP